MTTTLQVESLWWTDASRTGRSEVVLDADGRLLSCRPLRRRSGRGRPLAIVPGLVNAHAHLQLGSLPSGPRPDSFVAWLGAVMAQGATATLDVARERARRHLEQLHASGCTAVGEIDSTGASPVVLRAGRVAGRCYRELTGFHLAAGGARALLRERATRGTVACPAGWSPHAPYSVSPALFRAAFATGRPLAIHVAEDAAELELLHDGRGPFRELLERLDRLPPRFRAPGRGPVAELERLGVLSPRTALVHCQHLENGDVERIARAGAVVVVCPGTIRYFGRTAPPIATWLRAGVPVGIGTDSVASNRRRLSMLDEMRALRRLCPDLAPRDVFRAATRGGARALSRPSCGRLAVGRRADFVVVDHVDDPGVFVDDLTRGALTVHETRIAGQRVSDSPAVEGGVPST